MLPSASLSGGCCATVRTLLRLPTSDAATPPAFVLSQSPPASSHSCHHARPASDPSAAGRCPLQTDPYTRLLLVIPRHFPTLQAQKRRILFVVAQIHRKAQRDRKHLNKKDF